MHRLFFIPVFSFYLFCRLSLVTNYFYLFAFTWITFSLITFTWSPYKKKKPRSNLLPKTKQTKKRRVKKPDTLAGTKRHLFSSASSFFSVFIVVSPRSGSLWVNNGGCRCDTFITAMTFCDTPPVGSALLRQRQLESGSDHYQNHNSFHHKS